MVIIKQSSYPSARAEAVDDDVPLAFHAMARHLAGSK
jgi:hypothetical protein